jgi:hypothetical protein
MSIPVLHCKLIGGLVTKSDACSADLTNNTTSLVLVFLRSSSGIIWAVLPFEGAKMNEEMTETVKIK